ncbi:MAG: metallophosphoesterase [Schlesneria sp.]|nr:metallophosphoesterase [Schlesneria sp.]
MTQLSRRELLMKSSALFALSPVALELLSSSASAADPYADGVLVDGEPAAMQPGSFSIVVLPDTQNYSEKHPDIFLSQTKWIIDNQQSRNIACVLHLGDITNHNTVPEWENAVAAMSLLDGKVPYFMVPGNHDYSEKGGCKDRTTRLNDYFPVKQFRDLATFGGVYDKEPDRFENSFHLFSAEGRKFLVVALEFGPRRDVVRWANEVVSQHKDREAILITHAYMYFDDSRYDWKKSGKEQSWNPHAYPVAKATQDDVLDGEELWTNLVSRHENFIMTLNGHVLQDGLGRLTSATPGGRNVHQMLVNFQMRPAGGDGWLRLLEFRPDGHTVQVSDFSPTRKQCNRSAQNEFSLKLS